MATMRKPEIFDGPHGLRDCTEKWSQDDFTLYQINRIVEEAETLREDWLNGNTTAYTVTMSQWIAKWSLDVSSKLAEEMIKAQEEEAGA